MLFLITSPFTAIVLSGFCKSQCLTFYLCDKIFKRNFLHSARARDRMGASPILYREWCGGDGVKDGAKDGVKDRIKGWPKGWPKGNREGNLEGNLEGSLEGWCIWRTWKRFMSSILKEALISCVFTIAFPSSSLKPFWVKQFNPRQPNHPIPTSYFYHAFYASYVVRLCDCRYGRPNRRFGMCNGPSRCRTS